MAADFSFDVVSQVDPQELDNALNQTRKEIAGRFDFKNSMTSIENDDNTITIVADDELKLKNVVDILQSQGDQARHRPQSLRFQAGGTGRGEHACGRDRHCASGIAKDKSKPLIEAIKAAKLKVKTQYQDEQIRVSGKSKDDLQKVQTLLKGLDVDVPLQFVNYR